MKLKILVLILNVMVLLIVAGCGVQPGESVFGSSNFAGQAIGSSCESDTECDRGEECIRGVCSGTVYEEVEEVVEDERDGRTSRRDERRSERDLSEEEMAEQGVGYGGDQPIGDGTGKCGSGLTPCGSKLDCVHTGTDPSNCGLCGNWCFSQDKYPGVKKAECINSVCVLKECKTGLMLKDGKCVKVDSCLNPQTAADSCVIDIPDANLKKAILKQLGKSSGEVTVGEAKKVKGINAETQGISNLKGLEYFTQLKLLLLDSNSISDISALEGLTQLTTLYLGSNKISDISALKGLTSLKNLDLHGNNINDVSMLGGLTNLDYLTLVYNSLKYTAESCLAMDGFKNMVIGFDYEMCPLPQLYKNYNLPGLYTIVVGDGFENNDFLVKFVKFQKISVQNKVSSYVKTALFKKVGTTYVYYPYQDKITLDNKGYFKTGDNTNPLKMLGNIPLKLESTVIEENKNVFSYQSDCLFNDGCVVGDCTISCPFKAAEGEVQLIKDTYSIIVPKKYQELGQDILPFLEICYSNVLDFLGLGQNGMKVGLRFVKGSGSDVTHSNNFNVFLDDGEFELLGEQIKPSYTQDILGKKKCPIVSYMHNTPHELTHILYGDGLRPFGLSEGFSDFVGGNTLATWNYVEQTAVFNNTQASACKMNGFDKGDGLKLYVVLSTLPDVSIKNDYYFTGFCFWTDFVKMYGEEKFKVFSQKLYSYSHSTPNYYMWDVMEEAIGGPLSLELIQRYGLTKESTFVEQCEECASIPLN